MQIDFLSGRCVQRVLFLIGNPAAVCPSTRGYRMRRYCGWHNSITSRKPRFCVYQRGIELRWFTTLTEVNLCGHATLAAAYILFNELDYPVTPSF